MRLWLPVDMLLMATHRNPTFDVAALVHCMRWEVDKDLYLAWSKMDRPHGGKHDGEGPVVVNRRNDSLPLS